MLSFNLIVIVTKYFLILLAHNNTWNKINKCYLRIQNNYILSSLIKYKIDFIKIENSIFRLKLQLQLFIHKINCFDILYKITFN